MVARHVEDSAAITVYMVEESRYLTPSEAQCAAKTLAMLRRAPVDISVIQVPAVGSSVVKTVKPVPSRVPKSCEDRELAEPTWQQVLEVCKNFAVSEGLDGFRDRLYFDVPTSWECPIDIRKPVPPQVVAWLRKTAKAIESAARRVEAIDDQTDYKAVATVTRKSKGIEGGGA